MKYKKCKVVLLPHKEGIILKPNSPRRMVMRGSDSLWNNSSKFKSCNLYILSDEGIKEKDYFYNDLFGVVDKFIFEGICDASVLIKYNNNSHNFKIISSTDKSLDLPNIPEEFIKQYIDSWNKGEEIEDVDVEYADFAQYGKILCLKSPHNNESNSDMTIYKELSVVIDNEISIKPIKTSWNREEVEKLLNEVYNFGFNGGIREGQGKTGHDVQSISKWIKENL